VSPFLVKSNISWHSSVTGYASRKQENTTLLGSIKPGKPDDSTNRGVNDSTNRGVNDSTNRGVNDSTNRGVNDSTNRGVNDSVY
jgi:hypothetical protein